MEPAPETTEEEPPLRSTRVWFEKLYGELRRRARGEIFRHQALTLGATTLLHEAWLRLDGKPLEFASQAELVAYASRAMRGIVIDHIRARAAGKRGGDLDIVPFATSHDLQATPDREVLDVNEALQELAAADAKLAELVELRFFAGLSFAEIGALRGVSERTVQRDWDKARILLYTTLRR